MNKFISNVKTENGLELFSAKDFVTKKGLSDFPLWFSGLPENKRSEAFLALSCFIEDFICEFWQIYQNSNHQIHSCVKIKHIMDLVNYYMEMITGEEISQDKCNEAEQELSKLHALTYSEIEEVKLITNFHVYFWFVSNFVKITLHLFKTKIALFKESLPESGIINIYSADKESLRESEMRKIFLAIAWICIFGGNKQITSEEWQEKIFYSLENYFPCGGIND